MYLDKIIMRFTSNREIHGDRLKEPVRDSDNIVATNGKVLVVAPVKYFDKPFSIGEITDKFPRYKDLLKDISIGIIIHTTSSQDLYNAIKEMPVEDVYNKCNNCEGHGNLYTHKNNSRKCGECDGNGNCEYLGRIINRNNYLVSVMGVKFDPNILKDIATMALEVRRDIEWLFLGHKQSAALSIGDILVKVCPVMELEEFEGEVVEV